MSKHTPGPWQYRMVDNYSRIYMPGIIGPVLYGYTGEEDARLIAAAPDLLEALQGYESARIREVIHADGSATIEMDFRNEAQADAATSKVRAAIAKATGGKA